MLWNAGVFSLIRQLSETVVLPIAGLVLTFVATYELIQMILEKNNMHEFDVANIYKWVFKTTCAILILSNTFNIVNAVFDVSQHVIAGAGGLIQGSTDITPGMQCWISRYRAEVAQALQEDGNQKKRTYSVELKQKVVEDYLSGNAQLERENYLLKLENDLLKKVKELERGQA